jgi:SAM-dependent methyltransferase
MAKGAKFVYGVDIDKDSIEYSRQNYSASNVKFIVGDGTKIPLDDNSVDCVISMETIEHIADQDTFLKEIKRIMDPAGFIIVSTPNDKVYPKGNHFHIKEHNKESLLELLSKYFKNVELQYQVVSIASSVLSESEIAKDNDDLVNWDLYKVYKSKPNESIYYMAICSDQKLPTIKHNTLLSQEYSHMEQKKIADYLNNLSQHAENLRINLDSELASVKKLLASNETLIASNTTLNDELTRIKSSKYWRLRELGRRAKHKIKKSKKGK